MIHSQNALLQRSTDLVVQAKVISHGIPALRSSPELRVQTAIKTRLPRQLLHWPGEMEQRALEGLHYLSGKVSCLWVLKTSWDSFFLFSLDCIVWPYQGKATQQPWTASGSRAAWAARSGKHSKGARLPQHHAQAAVRLSMACGPRPVARLSSRPWRTLATATTRTCHCWVASCHDGSLGMFRQDTRC